MRIIHFYYGVAKLACALPQMLAGVLFGCPGRKKRGSVGCGVCVDFRLVDMYVLTATLLIRGSISLGGKRKPFSSYFLTGACMCEEWEWAGVFDGGGETAAESVLSKGTGETWEGNFVKESRKRRRRKTKKK